MMRERKNLVDLPNDIIQLIVESLYHGALFTPRYKDEDFDYSGRLSDYTSKCAEYYGQRNDDLDQRAQGLLSWSMSNRRFRAFLAPYLFDTIVLRDRPRSIESVKTLMRTPYWNDVRNLVFATTADSSREKYDETDSDTDEVDESGNESNETEDGDNRNDDVTHDTTNSDGVNSEETLGLAVNGGQHQANVIIDETHGKTKERNDKKINITGQEAPKDDAEFDPDTEVLSTAASLREILSHLPPNILCLVIDLPEMNEDCGQSLGGLASVADSCGLAAYRHTLRNVFSSISMNDIHDKDNFELRLYNVPPYRSDVYSLESWGRFLGNLTSFTLGFKSYDNGAGWRMNMHPPAIEVAPLLGDFFWNHFDRIQSFSLHCDSSWPLGGPDDLCQPLDLPLPESQVWKKLRDVSFKETFICPALLKFLRAHLKTIETIELIDCFSPNYLEYDDPAGFDITSHDGIRWDTFFMGLAETKSSSLREIHITYDSRSEKDLLDGLGNERGDTVHNQHDKYGMIFDGEEENAYKFMEGKYHEEWLKLVDMMLKNASFT